MAKFFDKIGYAQSTMTTPGVWTDTIVEKSYSGDVLRETKQWKEANQVNDDLTIGNRFSVVADDFALQNLSVMKYIIWSGVYWKISNIEIQRPRIIISVGGVYNGIKA